MRIRPVEEGRQEWELDEPAFRVLFWKEYPTHLGAPAPTGWTCEAFEIEGAEAPEVLAWALRTARPDRVFTLWVRVDERERGLGLVRLAGVDPTVSPEHRPANLR